jgi:nitroimidazol reductase NimA-like FMN-containing flavoprotein (pyridoxamine 5'-phosphate oxidase superfamily)
MTLGTADGEGQPWVSPVFFATAGETEFLWVSEPGARHSLNLVVRPEVSLVVFDSRAPIRTGRAVYVSALAGQVNADDLGLQVARFSARSVRHGGPAWTVADVQPPARHRLYRARGYARWVLDENDVRIPIT